LVIPCPLFIFFSLRGFKFYSNAILSLPSRGLNKKGDRVAGGTLTLGWAAAESPINLANNSAGITTFCELAACSGISGYRVS